jgi:hypothetical protein
MFMLKGGAVRVTDSVVVEIPGFHGIAGGGGAGAAGGGGVRVTGNLFVNTDVAFEGNPAIFTNNHVSGGCGSVACGGRYSNDFAGNFISDVGLTRGCASGEDQGNAVAVPYKGGAVTNVTIWNCKNALVSEGDSSDTAW